MCLSLSLIFFFSEWSWLLETQKHWLSDTGQILRALLFQCLIPEEAKSHSDFRHGNWTWVLIALDCIAGWSAAQEALTTRYPRKCKEVAKVMSRFYHWSEAHPYSGPGILVQCTDFFTGSPLSRRLQIKTSRRNCYRIFGINITMRN